MQPVKPLVPIVALLSLLVGGAVTFAVIRMLGKGSPELAFVVGAALGAQMAAVAHHRAEGAVSSTRVKAITGAALALGVIILGVILHFAFAPFEFPAISIPISAVGAFVFPFVLFDTMWNALSKRPKG